MKTYNVLVKETAEGDAQIFIESVLIAELLRTGEVKSEWVDRQPVQLNPGDALHIEVQR